MKKRILILASFASLVLSFAAVSTSKATDDEGDIIVNPCCLLTPANSHMTK